MKPSKRIGACIWIVVIILTVQGMLLSQRLNAENLAVSGAWPKFGLCFQSVKDPLSGSQRFWFDWDTHGKVEKLIQRNINGLYVRYYNLYQVCPALSNKVQVDYDYVMKNHPEWILRYKDGSPIYGAAKEAGVRLDLGNPQFVDYAISWLRQHGLSEKEFRGHLGLDCAMFMFADPKWANYDTHEAYRDAWEYFLRRISEAFRPQHKVILNVGSCDLPTFARMIKWVDGVLFEGLGSKEDAIRDQWSKGLWCAEHGKVWAVRHNATIAALKLTPAPGTPSFFLSVGDREIIVSSLGQQVLGKIDLTRPNADTVGKVANCLKDFNINVTVATPYPETPSLGAFQPLTYTKVEGGLTMKLKQAPREAFLFGYAAVLMAAGPNSYFILGDERNQEYYYPEMDWDLGEPKGEMREATPQVFRRDFKNYAAFLNLSQAPFTLPDSRALAPFRGALVPIPR